MQNSTRSQRLSVCAREILIWMIWIPSMSLLALGVAGLAVCWGLSTFGSPDKSVTTSDGEYPRSFWEYPSDRRSE